MASIVITLSQSRFARDSHFVVCWTCTCLEPIQAKRYFRYFRYFKFTSDFYIKYPIAQTHLSLTLLYIILIGCPGRRKCTYSTYLMGTYIYLFCTLCTYVVLSSTVSLYKQVKLVCCFLLFIAILFLKFSFVCKHKINVVYVSDRNVENHNHRLLALYWWLRL